jgi:hypothetical protein
MREPRLNAFRAARVIIRRIYRRSVNTLCLTLYKVKRKAERSRPEPKRECFRDALPSVR